MLMKCMISRILLSYLSTKINCSSNFLPQKFISCLINVSTYKLMDDVPWEVPEDAVLLISFNATLKQNG